MAAGLSAVLNWAEDVISPLLFTLLLAWMLYTVLHTLVSFKNDNLSITRAKATGDVAADEPAEEDVAQLVDKMLAASDEIQAAERKEVASLGEGTSLLGEGASGTAGSDDIQAEEEDEDWEGVESSEVEEQFAAAASLVTSLAASGGVRIGEGMQLLLYALYKQATEGPCTGAKPAVFNFKARAKWDAWNKLGSMSPEEAMVQYVGIVQQIVPPTSGGAGPSSSGEGGGGAGGARSVSRPADVAEEENERGPSKPSAHELASTGKVVELQALLKEDPSLAQQKDDEGRTPLHWAADRGHIDAVKCLLDDGADVNSTDGEGQTPLHYATVCEYEEVATLLLGSGADPTMPDADGSTPLDLKPAAWITAWPVKASA